MESALAKMRDVAVILFVAWSLFLGLWDLAQRTLIAQSQQAQRAQQALERAASLERELAAAKTAVPSKAAK